MVGWGREEAENQSRRLKGANPTEKRREELKARLLVTLLDN